MIYSKTLVAVVLVPSLAFAAQSTNNTLPVVDLGYARHQAAFYNSTGEFYNFSNIRYGAPPVGNLRWQLPQPPASNRSVVETGSQGRICSQASAAWLQVSGPFVQQYLAGQTIFNASSFPISSTSVPSIDPRETEDCLFLDVVVPKDILDTGDDGYGAPVLVWIHGGGYALGSKTDSGGPSGLLARSRTGGRQGVIFVSLNYRLGAFGFLGGFDVQSNGTANAGLYDQRLALKWIQDNIHLFGGDPNRVTVFGESAGGGSILAQITAFGGRQGRAPFAQALLQSPAFEPYVSSQQQEQIAKTYLSNLNVSTIDEARQLSYSDLYTANVMSLGSSEYGRFIFGPSVDGDLIPDVPGRLLARGLFDDNLRIMTAHNSEEGILFTSPFQQNNSEFEALVKRSLPDVTAFPEILSYLTETLYPPIFNDSSKTSYTSQVGRAALFNSELLFTCNAYYASKAFSKSAHSYLFSTSSGIHSADVPYSFYTGNGEPQPSAAASAFGGVIHPRTALVLQGYITEFALTGHPNSKSLPYLPRYGHNATMMVMNGTTFDLGADPAANVRCDWLQQGRYY
ncbi:hypothetical protein AAFC00_005040 [Neodothiora populina]|uniref:Carboxylic ester hydrolase n=1 Tax=Neodothiora populina TaxID=2781224 RepID=A0ABR3PJZ2_9PEZI